MRESRTLSSAWKVAANTALWPVGEGGLPMRSVAGETRVDRAGGNPTPVDRTVCPLASLLAAWRARLRSTTVGVVGAGGETLRVLECLVEGSESSDFSPSEDASGTEEGRRVRLSEGRDPVEGEGELGMFER